MFSTLVKLYTHLLSYKFNTLGKGSIIKPFLNSSNESHISIGKNVNIGAWCRITVSTEFGGIRVGSKNKIKLRIGDNVDIGNNSFISANNNVTVGNNVIMSAYVFITDHDHGYEDIAKTLHNQPLTVNGHAIIEDNVFLGVKSTVLKNICIGRHSVVAANSVVTKNVPAYSVVAGNPAKVVKSYNFKSKKWEKPKMS